MRTLENVSEVGTTAIRPTINARPDTGSMPKMKGNTRLSPAYAAEAGKDPHRQAKQNANDQKGHLLRL